MVIPREARHILTTGLRHDQISESRHLPDVEIDRPIEDKEARKYGPGVQCRQQDSTVGVQCCEPEVTSRFTVARESTGLHGDAPRPGYDVT